VINFHDWPLDRSAEGAWAQADEPRRKEWRRSGRVPRDYPGPVAADYPECLKIIEAKVRPERQRRKSDGTYQLRSPLPQRYWQYADKRPELYATIAGSERVLVAPRVSAHHIVASVPTEQVFADRLVVLAIALEWSGVLFSTIHDVWAHRPGSTTHETRNTYFPEEAFETFPFHDSSSEVLAAAREYQAARESLLRNSTGGLRELYNCFHSKSAQDQQICELRLRRVALDLAIARAYQWAFDLGHDFIQTTDEGTRFTITEAARQEVLDRLLELNHQRYTEEVARGLHQKAASKGRNVKATPRSGKSPKASPLLEDV
jgi:hypothetical protein